MKLGETWWINFDKKNKPMTDQLTTVSKLHLIDLEGRLSKTDMKKLEKALKIQLGLSS